MVPATIMARPSRWIVALLPLLALPMLAGSGCTVDAVGLDSCRKIEQQRCEAAPSCAGLKVTDVTSCKRYYRDQCLHGLAVDTDPGGPVVDKCVAAIKAAGACAASAPDAPCAGVALTAAKPNASACDVVTYPEISADCAWLIPAAPAPTPAATDAGTDAADASTDGM